MFRFKDTYFCQSTNGNTLSYLSLSLSYTQTLSVISHLLSLYLCPFSSLYLFLLIHLLFLTFYLLSFLHYFSYHSHLPSFSSLHFFSLSVFISSLSYNSLHYYFWLFTKQILKYLIKTFPALIYS